MKAALCAAGAIAGLIIAAPSALADPDAAPAPPSLAAPAPPPAAPAPPPATPAALPAPADGIPHLSSPDNLPPDTTDTAPPGQSQRLGYLRELWQAYQNQDISGKEAAILALTQRPMDPNAAPPPGLAPGPPGSRGAPPSPGPQLPN